MTPRAQSGFDIASRFRSALGLGSVNAVAPPRVLRMSHVLLGLCATVLVLAAVAVGVGSYCAAKLSRCNPTDKRHSDPRARHETVAVVLAVRAFVALHPETGTTHTMYFYPNGTTALRVDDPLAPKGQTAMYHGRWTAVKQEAQDATVRATWSDGGFLVREVTFRAVSGSVIEDVADKQFRAHPARLAHAPEEQTHADEGAGARMHSSMRRNLKPDASYAPAQAQTPNPNTAPRKLIFLHEESSVVQ